jgi:hypothetical protein
LPVNPAGFANQKKNIMSKNTTKFSRTRRNFLGSASAATLAAGVIGSDLLTNGVQAQKRAKEPDFTAPTINDRRDAAANLRIQTATTNRDNTPPNIVHTNNGDENLYPNRIASYSKGLPHRDNGEVAPSAYRLFLRAVNSGAAEDFNNIPKGLTRSLTNPQGGLAYEIEGPDAQSMLQPPPPTFASREEAAEIAENYWMAVLRDVPFRQYPTNAAALAAAADLTLYGADFKGPKDGSTVTPALLFRGLTPGDRVGPYLSQYFHLPLRFGAQEINQRIRTTVPNVNYMTTFSEWLNVQRGFEPPEGQFDPTLRYMRNGRDIGEWVHIDVLFQAYFQAFLILAGLNAPLDDNNPYNNSPNQIGFATFGGPHIATLLCEVSTRALHAVWYQKWIVHRRLRPEVFAARVDRTAYAGAGYPVHPEILADIGSNTRLGGYLPAGNALLPMAFPEGSPTHPAYGAGHATVAGACVTILKAWFKETTPIVNLTQPLQVSDDGLTLTNYTGADAGQMTVGGELNKIAANVAVGRNIAGVHWRSDATESMKLGESIALKIMAEQRPTYNEPFNGFSVTKFDGTTVTV